MKKSHCLFVFSVFICFSACAQSSKTNISNVDLKLPNGFVATKVADNLGIARHIAVAANGDLFVKLDKLKNGKGIYLLHDADKDGVFEQMQGFGNFTGTGIYLKDGYLYASSNEDVYRFKLDANNKPVDADNPDKIISGLIERNEHEAKAITLDNNGNIYVNIGAYSNSCQTDDRATGSMGMQPCPILDSAAGIWQFKTDKPNQTYGDGVRYATGLRNVVGLNWNTQTNSLFVTQHGRDQLHDIFPDMFTDQQSADLPAECMYELHNGSNCGWPYMYYDQIKHKKILAPEYGGDGKKEYTGEAQDPVVAFPGHMAPDGLLFYTGNMFPEKYTNGAFIAFHGSWNRSPEPQKGYFVAFVPFKDGKPSGDWEIFADNFSGGANFMQPGKARHRPCGLAQGPDGALYVSDDVKGTIYRISYTGK
ncbi:MAG: PQQ-dependent sugar dehydrogenase [Parafilimonas sp.]|nr:PQQ-dependent sugar dehydrogenase [Parafilimonas sp.]